MCLDPFVRRERTLGSTPSTATPPTRSAQTPPFQGWDTTVRRLLAEVQILSVALRFRGPLKLRYRNCKLRSIERSSNRSLASCPCFRVSRAGRRSLPTDCLYRASRSRYRTSLTRPLSQSVLGTAAAHSCVRDGSIPSAATRRPRASFAMPLARGELSWREGHVEF